MTESATMSSAPPRPAIPDFEAPPVIEVALGVQFEPGIALSLVELGPLRDLWRDAYPDVEQHPPLPPLIESDQLPQIGVQVVMGQIPPFPRQWFVSASGHDLIQLQPDRLVVNWRKLDTDAPYPRYEYVRDRFDSALSDVSSFVGGSPRITQIEVSYINAIPVSGQGQFDNVFVWGPTAEFGELHHLGFPTSESINMVYDVTGIGKPPVRMHVSVQPARAAATGQDTLLMTLTVRGAPADDSSESSRTFLDEARVNIVQSFAEMTTREMHELWGRKA